MASIESSSRGRHRYVALVIFVLSGTANAPGVALGDDEISVEQVLAAWTARARVWSSGVFEWTETREYLPAFVNGPESIEMERNAGEKVLAPPDPYTAPGKLMINGEWMRFETSRANGTRYLSSYDGDSSRMLFVPDAKLLELSTGSILRVRHNTDTPSAALRPLMLFLRPLERNATGLRAAALSVRDSQTRTIDAHRCILVFDEINELWVDPTAGFIVRRWIETHPQGHQTYQIDITYTEKSGVLVPSRWRTTRFSPVEPGEPDIITDAELKRWSHSVRLQKSDFALSFPPGTSVYDNTTGEEYIVPEDAR